MPWLRPALAVSVARSLGMGFALAFAVAPASAEPDVARAMQLAREATVAADEKDFSAYLAKMEEAVALRPDFPRMLVNLAAAQVANDRPADAVATLGRLAAMGLDSPVERAADFAAIRERADFKAVVKKLSDNRIAKGRGEIAFSLRGFSGLPEGIAWRETTGEFYLSDVNGRAVWVWSRAADAREGKLRRLTPEGDALYGVMGLALDEARGTLWAATSAVAAMRGFTPDMDGTAALAEIDLNTGEIRRTIPIVRRAGDRQSHVLGDLALAPDGGVFVTDSGGPMIWRLAPGAAELEVLVESEEFLSLQGLVVAPGGGALIVSDHANGLLRVALDGAPEVRRIASPPDTTLIGLDGLALAPNGDIVAIQNGLRPTRVLSITLDPAYENATAVKVLESAHLPMAAPSLGTIVRGNEFHFIGNAGWSRFQDLDGKVAAPRSVPIFKTLLPAPEKKPPGRGGR